MRTLDEETLTRALGVDAQAIFSVETSFDAAAIGVSDSLAVSSANGDGREDDEAEGAAPTSGNYEDDTFGYEDEDFEVRLRSRD